LKTIELPFFFFFSFLKKKKRKKKEEILEKGYKELDSRKMSEFLNNKLKSKIQCLVSRAIEAESGPVEDVLRAAGLYCMMGLFLGM
jgi:hypothetical protein